MELAVLTATKTLGDKASGPILREEVERVSARPVSYEHVCAITNRLEALGYVAPGYSEGRRVFKVTPTGKLILSRGLREALICIICTALIAATFFTYYFALQSVPDH